MGLAWAGKTTPRDRSIPLDELVPLLGDPRYAAFSFQLGPRAADIKDIAADALITDLGPRLADFAESAALLARMDLLVTIDTSIAHLAGALGIPTFLLLLYTSDWRWFDEGETSAWYPSMRLFRQERPNDWERPLAQLGKALEAFADERVARARERAREKATAS
jgi:ADP-heptose:LPS heptosyltransferase